MAMQSSLTPEGIAALAGASKAGGAYQDRLQKERENAQKNIVDQQKLSMRAQEAAALNERSLVAQKQADERIEIDRQAEARAAEEFRKTLKLRQDEADLLLEESERARAERNAKSANAIREQQRGRARDALLNDRSDLPPHLQRQVNLEVERLNRQNAGNTGIAGVANSIANNGGKFTADHLVQQLAANTVGQRNGGNPSGTDILTTQVGSDPAFISGILGLSGFHFTAAAAMGPDGAANALQQSAAFEAAGLSPLGNHGALAALSAKRAEEGDPLHAHPAGPSWAAWLFTQGMADRGYYNPSGDRDMTTGEGGWIRSGRGRATYESTKSMMSDPQKEAKRLEEMEKGHYGYVSPFWFEPEERDLPKGYEEHTGSSAEAEMFRNPETHANFILHNMMGGGGNERIGEGAVRVSDHLFNTFNRMNIAGGSVALSSGEADHIKNVFNSVFETMVYGVWDNNSSTEAVAQAEANIKSLIESSPDSDLTSHALGFLHEQLRGMSAAFEGDEGGMSGISRNIRDSAGNATGIDSQFNEKHLEAINAQLEAQGIDPNSVEGLEMKGEVMDAADKTFEDADRHVFETLDTIVRLIDPHIMTEQKAADMNGALFASLTAKEMGEEWNRAMEVTDPAARRSEGLRVLGEAMDTSINKMQEYMITNDEVSNENLRKYQKMSEDAFVLMDAALAGTTGPHPPMASPQGTITADHVIEVAQRIASLEHSGDPFPPEIRAVLKNPIMAAQIHTAGRFINNLRAEESGDRLDQLSTDLNQYDLDNRAALDALKTQQDAERKTEEDALLQLYAP